VLSVKINNQIVIAKGLSGKNPKFEMSLTLFLYFKKYATMLVLSIIKCVNPIPITAFQLVIKRNGKE